MLIKVTSITMKTKSRIASILKTNGLDFSITDVPSFDLNKLQLTTDLEFQLPTNVRLGHLAEKIVSELIKSSSNYSVLYENLQIIEQEKTIGEIDFILQNENTKQLVHVELAYKFYLFDPTLSSEIINNWIGPNRNDSLQEKLEKLKSMQFPLLYHTATKATLPTLACEEVSQALCFLVSLFIPYEYKPNFSPVYQKAIKGYYFNLKTFIKLDNPTKNYYLPTKKEWGMEPADNETWCIFSEIEKQISISITEKQVVLCWQKQNDSYLSFFIVWW